MREAQFYDAKKRADGLEETVLDHQSTIAQFRDLVVNLQSCVFLLLSLAGSVLAASVVKTESDWN